MTDRRLNVTLAALPITYLALALWVTRVDDPFLWGLNHLRYFPVWVHFLCGGVLFLAAVPVVRD